DSFGPDLAPVTDGLGFLPGTNGVHMDSERRRRALLHELVAAGTLGPALCTDDGTGTRESPHPIGCGLSRMSRWRSRSRSRSGSERAGLACLEAGGARVDALAGAVDHSADGLDVRVPATRVPAVRVGHALAEARVLGADVTRGSSHCRLLVRRCSDRGARSTPAPERRGRLPGGARERGAPAVGATPASSPS